MTRITGFVVLGLSIMVGCARTVMLYPVQGPLAAQTPPVVQVAELGFGFDSGNLSVVLNDGEICSGRWAQALAPAATPMSSAWDTVYGRDFYVANVLGSELFARALLTGNRGTTLSVEFNRPGGQQGLYAIKGVAKDNRDNIYKVAF